MDLEDSMKVYQDVMHARGSQETDLLGVLRHALHHNAVHTLQALVIVEAREGGIDRVLKGIAGRTALVNRHLVDLQKALEEVYKIAEEKGYTDVKEVFERKYPSGHDFGHL